MTRVAKATLAASCILSVAIIWGVHYQQNQERETMYQGVLRDDERRKEKMKKREDDLKTSLLKREEYERVQSVTPQTKSV